MVVPGPDIPYDTTLGAMKTLAEKIAKITRGYTEYAHPLDVNHALEPEYLKAAAEVTREMKLAHADSQALHAGDGQPGGRGDSRRLRQAARPQCLPRLRQGVRPLRSGALPEPAEFRGEYLDPYVLAEGRAAHPHVSLGGRVRRADRGRGEEAGSATDCRRRSRSGFRTTAITAIKIKLNGSDLAWDVDRVAAIDRVTTAAQAKRGVRDWVYSLDFNERCPNVQYLLDFERQLKEKAPARVRPRAVHRAAHGARPRRRPEEHHVRSRQTAAGGDRRIADRVWIRCCWRARWATPAWR